MKIWNKALLGARAIIVAGLLGCLAYAGCATTAVKGDSAARLTVGGVTQASNCRKILGGWLMGLQRVPPKALSSPLRAGTLSKFAIFRRAAQPTDEPPIPASSLGRELAKYYELSRYYSGYIRKVGALPGGRRYFVVPAFGRADAVPPADCQPVAVRRELAQQRRRLRIEPVYCIIATDGREKVSVVGCEFFDVIDEGRPVFDSLGAITREPAVGLVPDGVASLRIAYRETGPIIVPVSDNAFIFTPPRPGSRVQAKLDQLSREYGRRHPALHEQNSLARRWDDAVAEAKPTRVEWLNGVGGVLRTINAPPANAKTANPAGVPRTPVGG
jgi:hypothetical protein